MGDSRLHDVFEAVQRCVSDGVLPLVIFDLDSTLFSARTRDLRILAEFAAEHADDPVLAEVVSGVTLADLGWDLAKPLRTAGIDEGLLTELTSFWRARFFTDAYAAQDAPIAGAPAYAQRLHQAGAFLYYLTGRHVGGMEQGTASSLLRHGFPIFTGRSTLHLKPSFGMNDRAFKDAALDLIRGHFGQVVATFENDPTNANLFVRAFPQALHFLLLTEHGPDVEVPLPALIGTPDFL